MQITFWRAAALFVFKVLVLCLLFIGLVAGSSWLYEIDGISDGYCNIAVLPIEGVILPFAAYDEYPLVTTPKQVRDFYERAESDPFIEGVLLEINSPGGAPVASEQVADTIRESSLPSIAAIGDVGASGAYLVAAGAKEIVASTMSDVGSLGVTMSYLENSKKNEEDGLTFVELNTAKFKDAGNPDKAITEEEKDRFKQDLDIIHRHFIEKIAAYRNVSYDEMQALADGASMPGSVAKEKKLVDHLGGRATARERLAESLSIPVEEVVLCPIEEPLTDLIY